ncbi:unnamed protein product [Urochloa humidicola]
MPPRLLRRALLVAAFSAAAIFLVVLLQHHHGPKPRNPSTASRARAFSDELPDDSPPAERDPEVGGAAVAGDEVACATVERMGEEAAGAARDSPERASLRVHKMIRRHFELNGLIAQQTLLRFSFFLKNVHPRMKAAASALFGLPDSLDARPNTFGELMRGIISPSSTVQAAVNWAMPMLANRPARARKAAVLCIKRALQICSIKGTPRVALVSDTQGFVKEIKSDISEFAEVLYFDYKLFTKTSGLEIAGNDKAFQKLTSLKDVLRQGQSGCI